MFMLSDINKSKIISHYSGRFIRFQTLNVHYTAHFLLLFRIVFYWVDSSKLRINLVVTFSEITTGIFNGTHKLMGCIKLIELLENVKYNYIKQLCLFSVQ